MIDERGYRYERCAICGDWVNVAIRQTIPDDGYVCPRCRRRERRERELQRRLPAL